MSILKTLKLTAATRNAPLTPEQMLRGKLVSYLNEQKALAEAEISGTSFVATKKVTRKNAEGENIRVDAPRHVRKGWFTDAEGKMYRRSGVNRGSRSAPLMLPECGLERSPWQRRLARS